MATAAVLMQRDLWVPLGRVDVTQREVEGNGFVMKGSTSQYEIAQKLLGQGYRDVRFESVYDPNGAEFANLKHVYVRL